MGNLIYHNNKYVKMANSITDVFIVTMGLSGSLIAKADYEKAFVVWLLTKDQDFVGHGTIGFDVCEMPWSLANFNEEKAFLINAATGVKNRIGWDKLPYSPNEEILFPCIDEFLSLLEEFIVEYVDEKYRHNWINDGNPLYRLGHGIWIAENKSYKWVEGEISNEIQGYVKCSKHGLYLTYFGCILCKN